ncbi:SusC/RagA family TonB-linked outer membrane protein [Chitinophaga sp. GCM10012297]|uniref:SusC/RagA family TonB-linked outer membrane protein n=1 Tax=Chitinophaga chungangae TaxID=2821488 RepID=A0ABS3YHW1_9BACT|nr:SusC/RagA family TonB-linked outer membrane protein [Chitinophaga chungangae]MBO9154277.1 SusC/RagA family TonB-linked outer membrane protein [Chitinophaga chungangae]
MTNPLKKQHGRWKTLPLLLLLQLAATLALAQVRISGKVTGNDGSPVPGVTVQLRNSSTGASSDANGQYSFNANIQPGNYTLEFTGIGFKTVHKNISVSGATVSADAVMEEDVLNMDEIVVIGSSLRQSRKQLGNTVNSVSSKQLVNTGSGNIGAALQGKVPGAQITQTSGDPSGGISVRMRGTSTIKGSSEPLYVIDGVIVSNATTNVTNLNVGGGPNEVGTNRMADINPNDIEKIDVIPGASASAIYGSRASNGVVLITTKAGKAGRLSIDFSTGIMLNQLRKKVYISTYGKQFGSAALRLGNISNGPGNTITYTRGDGQVRTLSTDLVDVTRYDYQDQIFQTGLGTDNYLSLSGGTEKTKYYFSGGYYKNEGIIRNTDFRRFNFKTRIQQVINDYITLSGGVAYTNSFSHEKPNGNVFWSPINSVNITNNLYNIEERDAAGNLKGVEPTRVNPLSVIEDMQLTQAVSRTITDFQVKLTPAKGLSIDYILGIDNFSQEGNNLIKRYPYISAQEGLGYVSSALVNSFLINNDFNVSYNAQLGDFSSLTTAGFNHQYQKITGLFNQGRDLLNGITTINGAATRLDPSYTYDQRQVFGGFVQETFGYKNIVFLTAAGRIDGSTSFPKDTRTYFYPKVSASWNISEMGFWKDFGGNWFNAARLRASWGLAGNLTGIGTYQRFSNYSSGSLNGLATYNLDASLGNEFVEPERSSEFEFGTDLSFLNNRLGVVFTAYNKKIVGNSLLVDRVLAPSSGGSSRIENVGDLTNKGWELGITALPVSTKNFSWNVGGSLSRNKNKVTASSQVTPITLANAAGSPSVIIAGEPVGVFYGNYFERDGKGIALDSEGRPIAAIDDKKVLLRKVIGDPNPDWLLSFNSMLTYKKLSFSFLIDGALGQDVFNADRRTRQGVGIGDYSEREIKGELPRGYIFSIYNTEEWRVEDASYVKLREVALTYELPQFAKFIRSSSLSLVGRNLLSFDDYDGYDPETNAGGNSSVLRGVDFGNVPIPRTYQFTFRASF